jgi:hypothetical protein
MSLSKISGHEVAVRDDARRRIRPIDQEDWPGMNRPDRIVMVAHALAWLILIALAGLLLQGLVVALQFVGIAVVAVTLRRLMRAGIAPSLPCLRHRHPSPESIAMAIVAGVPLLLVLSPGWNFQWGWQWDQGLYETFANHYASSGSFWWDLAVERSVLGPRTVWLDVPATYVEQVGGLGGEPVRATRLPGYPVWLALVKLVVGVAGPSWLGNVAIGTIVALLIYRLGRLVGGSNVVAASVAILLTANIAYLYNAKQYVAEPLGLLGLLLVVFGLLDRTMTLRVQVSLVFTGTAIALLTRMDAWQPILLLAAASVVAAGGEQRLRPLVTTMLATAAAVAAALPSLTTEPYLRTLQLPGLIRNIEWLPILAARGSPLALVLIGIVASGAAVTWLPGVQRILGTLLSLRWSTAVRRGAPTVLAGTWLMFGVWAWFLRPQGLEVDDLTDPALADAFNLRRLAELWSPVALAGVFGAMILPLRQRERTLRWVTFAFALAFALVILDAQNQPSELWWVRRYLLTFAPLGVLVLAPAGESLLEIVRDTQRPRVDGIVGGGLWVPIRRALATAVVGIAVIGLGLQAATLPALLTARQNTGLDRLVAASIEKVPAGTPLIVVATDDEVDAVSRVLGSRDRVTTGIGAAIRAARTDLTLIEVPRWQVGCLARELGVPVAVLDRDRRALGDRTTGLIIAAGSAEVRFPLWRTSFRSDAPPRGAERTYAAYDWTITLVESRAPSMDSPVRLTGFIEFGDSNGLIHWLGTHGSRTAPHDAFCNPGLLDAQLLNASSVFRGDFSAEEPAGATDRSTGANVPGLPGGESFHSMDEADAWWQLDVGPDALFRPALLTIQQRRWFTEPTPHLLRDFVIETSLDGADWQFLASFRHTGEGGEWQAFPLRSGQDVRLVRFLRIRKTDGDPTGQRYLVIGEIEFYGVLERTHDQT